MTEHNADEWHCPSCGATEHDEITLYGEVEIDVTCESVYITPLDGGDGFAFGHAEFDRVIEHYRNARRDDDDTDPIPWG